MSPVPGDNRQDPHNPNNDDLSIAAMETNIIMTVSSSSSGSDDEDGGYQGYQMLPQDPSQQTEGSGPATMETQNEGAAGVGSTNSEHLSLQHSTDDGNTSIKTPSYMQAPSIDNQELIERKSLWSQSHLHPQEPMDDDHMNKIKSAMSGFSLPGCQIPEWARVVSEDEWKSQLISRLHGQVPLISSNNTEIPPDDPEPALSDPPNKRARCALDQGVEEGEGDTEMSSSGDAGSGSKVVTDDNTDNNPTEER